MKLLFEPPEAKLLLLKVSNFAIGCERAIASTAASTIRPATTRPAGRGGVASRRPISAKASQTSAAATHAIPITTAARCPWWTATGSVIAPASSSLRWTRAATETAPAPPATAAAARAGQRLGASRRYTTTATMAAANAPRDEVRYMTAPRIGSGSAASALATRDRREAMRSAARAHPAARAGAQS